MLIFFSGFGFSAGHGPQVHKLLTDARVDGLTRWHDACRRMKSFQQISDSIAGTSRRAKFLVSGVAMGADAPSGVDVAAQPVESEWPLADWPSGRMVATINDLADLIDASATNAVDDNSTEGNEDDPPPPSSSSSISTTQLSKGSGADKVYWKLDGTETSSTLRTFWLAS